MDLGNLIVQIIFSPGHTETNICLFVPEDKVLYSADCIVNGYIPNMEDGNKNLWLTWKKSLEKLKGLGAEKIIPGHGRVIEGENLPKAFDAIERHLDRKLNNKYGT